MRLARPLTSRGVGSLILAVVSFVGAVLLGSVGLLGFGILLTTLVCVSVVSVVLTRRRLEADRALSPAVVAVGEECRVSMRVRATSAIPTARGTWRDHLPAAVTGSAAGTFPALGSGLRSETASLRIAYTVRAVRRGDHELGPLVVMIRDPFGLAQGRARSDRPTLLTVCPVVEELAPWPTVAGMADGTSSTSTAGQGAADLLARAYEPGDSMRRIHWRATAHHDTLMVRQEEHEAVPEAMVVFDRSAARWSPSASSPGADPLFERAVSSCASVTRALVRAHYAVHVCDAAGRPLTDQATVEGEAMWAGLWRRLAILTGDDETEPMWPRVASGLRSGPLVLITGSLTGEDVSALSPLTAQGTHAVLLAARAEPGTIREARHAGWRAASLSEGADLTEIWAAMSPEHATAAETHDDLR